MSSLAFLIQNGQLCSIQFKSVQIALQLKSMERYIAVWSYHYNYVWEIDWKLLNGKMKFQKLMLINRLNVEIWIWIEYIANYIAVTDMSCTVAYVAVHIPTQQTVNVRQRSWTFSLFRATSRYGKVLFCCNIVLFQCGKRDLCYCAARENWNWSLNAVDYNGVCPKMRIMHKSDNIPFFRCTFNPIKSILKCVLNKLNV